MPPKDKNKPRGKMSSYAYFVQTCREEHRKKHPGETVVFAEFSKKCAEKWKTMGPKEKRRFEELAEKDKSRYEREMSKYVPPPGEKGGKRKRIKDPNAPKRALSGFFFFCNEERGSVKKQYPSYGVGEIAKELGKRWEKCPDKPRFEAMSTRDKQRYEREMAVYKGKKPKVVAAPVPVEKPVEDDDDDDDEEDDDDDDDEEDDDDDE